MSAATPGGPTHNTLGQGGWSAKPMANGKWTKKELLSRPVEHIDITAFDARPVIDSYREMAYSSRTLANAADIYSMMLKDKDCAVILTLAGSLISAGLKKAIITLIENNMVDAIVSTGANIVDQDFFEGLGFKHYIAPGSPEAPPVDDMTLRN
jgi:deoxyhypusine synthase